MTTISGNNTLHLCVLYGFTHISFSSFLHSMRRTELASYLSFIDENIKALKEICSIQDDKGSR